MTEGISPNKLNDISKVYLDTIYKHNTGENKIDQEREKWSKSAETQKEGYKGTADLSKADPAAKKKVEDRIEKWAGKRVPGGKEGVKESLSNWRTDLREISDAIPETEKKTEKEVTEKKVKNKIEINPKISEAVAEMGGEVLSVEEQTAPVEEDPAIKAKEKRQAMIKKQVLNKKLQAVRQGAGQDIVASYDPEGKAIAENALEKRAKENEKARKWLKKDAKDSGYTDIALKASMSKGAGVNEAKVDKGRSDYGKATIRNWRHSGPKTVDPAMFDPENKRGKTIDKRREEHKARRGVKKAKVPTYTKEETIDEEGYDRMRDKHLERGGIGAVGSHSRRSTNYHSRPDTPEQKKRKQAASDEAYKSVVAKLKKKYGDGVMTSSKKIRKGKEVK